MKPKFSAKNKDGKIKFIDPVMVEMYLVLMPEDVEVSISKPTKSRSSEQNRYMWGVPYKLISEHTGYTVEDIHEWCREYILAKIVIPEKCIKTSIKGKESFRIPSTTSLTTSEMEKYLSEIRQWASLELGINIPMPNEIDFYDS